MLHIKYLYVHWVPLGEYPKKSTTLCTYYIKAVKLGQYRGQLFREQAARVFPSFSL